MRRFATALLALAITTPVFAQSVVHPLDPLTWNEYWTVLETLQRAGHLEEETSFSLIQLVEPDKQTVWSYQPGASFSRRAQALLRQETQAYRAEIDLSAEKLISWQKLEDIEANLVASEILGMEDVVKAHPEVKAALARRGYEQLDFVECSGPPPGYYDTPEQKGRRVANYTCADARRARNTWTREIPGVTAVVDLETREVLKVVEEEIVEGGPRWAEYDRGSLGEPREVPGPIFTTQPSGRGYERDHNVFEWQNWRFHVRADQRVGPIVSTVSYAGRPVLYQGFLSEMFVPYMDPSFAWYQRNFLDLGEFSTFGVLKTLVEGDCPPHAEYLSTVQAGANGRPVDVSRVLCVFEREAGDMSWRHAGDGPQSRVKRDLVVRSAAVVGNYDYIFDWTFQQDGTIRIAVGATGIVESKAVSQATADVSATTAELGAVGAGSGIGAESSAIDAVTAAGADAYGHFVDRHVVAVNHDHYFSFRLDLDVDGPDNEFRIDRLVSKELPKDHPRRSLWVVEGDVAHREAEAQLDIDLKRPALWRVTSSSHRNHVGYPTSYQLTPGRNAATLLSPDDYPRRRAGFIDHHLWVTPYDPQELYAAGEYPTLSKPGMGLPGWTRDNRSLEQGDVVLWHTVAMHHFVRAEDFPVMPVMWHSFELRPFDFFDQNPAMDLP